MICSGMTDRSIANAACYPTEWPKLMGRKQDERVARAVKELNCIIFLDFLQPDEHSMVLGIKAFERACQPAEYHKTGVNRQRNEMTCIPITMPSPGENDYDMFLGVHNGNLEQMLNPEMYGEQGETHNLGYQNSNASAIHPSFVPTPLQTTMGTGFLPLGAAARKPHAIHEQLCSGLGVPKKPRKKEEGGECSQCGQTFSQLGFDRAYVSNAVADLEMGSLNHIQREPTTLPRRVVTIGGVRMTTRVPCVDEGIYPALDGNATSALVHWRLHHLKHVSASALLRAGLVPWTLRSTAPHPPMVRSEAMSAGGSSESDLLHEVYARSAGTCAQHELSTGGAGGRCSFDHSIVDISL
ncbi:hypothetical protein EI94DRAFT_1782232 [Lactarius quietus]|nr:hypothetical protein EI94DRAFT_1782232 [Lactarius quietus]